MFKLTTIAFAVSTLFLAIANFKLRYPTKHDLIKSLDRKTKKLNKMEALIKKNAELKEANYKNQQFIEELIQTNQGQAQTIQSLKNRISF